MTTGLYKKGLVLAIIGLFIGTGVVPSICGNIEQTKSKDLKNKGGEKNEVE